jgi:hypothetical protein
MKRTAWMMAAALAANGLFALSIPTAMAADPATPVAPAQSDNQMSGAGGNTMQNSSNNAGAAVNNGGLVDNNANSNSNASSSNSTSDTVRNKVDQAGAGTPTADNPAPDAKAIRKRLAKVADEALDKNDLSDLVSYFSTDARDRIKKSDTYDQGYGDKLDGRIEQINMTWKQKFGHEFKVKDANDALGDSFATIQQGVVGKDADLTTAVMQDSNNSKLEDGRSIAVAQIKGNHGMADLKVPLIHELPNSWKINVPGDLDAAKLRQNLTDHLTALGDHVNDWPSDEQAAYRVVTHHVFMAIMNKPVEWKGGDASASDAGNMNGMSMGK